jgi:hypothetical protein
MTSVVVHQVTLKIIWYVGETACLLTSTRAMSIPTPPGPTVSASGKRIAIERMTENVHNKISKPIPP